MPQRIWSRILPQWDSKKCGSTKNTKNFTKWYGIKMVTDFLKNVRDRIQKLLYLIIIFKNNLSQSFL